MTYSVQYINWYIFFGWKRTSWSLIPVVLLDRHFKINYTCSCKQVFIKGSVERWHRTCTLVMWVCVCMQVWMPTYWLSSQRSRGTPPSNTWCWGRTSTSRAGTDHAGNQQDRWWWRWWWMFFLFSLPPQGVGWNSAETGSFGARGRLCEWNYVTLWHALTRART